MNIILTICRSYGKKELFNNENRIKPRKLVACLIRHQIDVARHNVQRSIDFNATR